MRDLPSTLRTWYCAFLEIRLRAICLLWMEAMRRASRVLRAMKGYCPVHWNWTIVREWLKRCKYEPLIFEETYSGGLKMAMHKCGGWWIELIDEYANTEGILKFVCLVTSFYAANPRTMFSESNKLYIRIVCLCTRGYHGTLIHKSYLLAVAQQTINVEL